MGGTGKTTATVHLGYALKRRGHSVGLLDVDCTAPKLAQGLGLEKAPQWELDTVREGIIPSEVGGLYFCSVASHFDEQRSPEKPAVLLKEEDLIDIVRQLVTGVVLWPDNLDYILMDSPPSSSGMMQALFDFLPNIYGVILVFQPTDMAAADLLRTLDFLKFKKVPILGLVENMAYCLSPSGEKYWGFLSPKVDLAPVCREFGVEVLGEIPQTPVVEVAEQSFDLIAERIEEAKPVILKEDIAAKLAGAIKGKVLKGVAKRL